MEEPMTKLESIVAIAGGAMLIFGLYTCVHNSVLQNKYPSTPNAKMQTENYRAIVGSGSDGSIMFEKLNLDNKKQ